MKVQSPTVTAIFVAACVAAPLAQALDAAAERAERDRIKTEQDRVEVVFVARERECRQRFVVTPCLDQARRDRRESLERLRQQQEVLDEAQRKKRAAQRIDEIRTKVSGEEEKQREAAVREPPRKEKQRTEVMTRSSPVQTAPHASAASGVASGGSQSSPARSVSLERKRMADYERRQQEAKAHKEAVEQRNAERAASGKPPAKGLPAPGAASATH